MAIPGSVTDLHMWSPVMESCTTWAVHAQPQPGFPTWLCANKNPITQLTVQDCADYFVLDDGSRLKCDMLQARPDLCELSRVERRMKGHAAPSWIKHQVR
jgi:hypothetical protein